jgi:hypothetical protein
LRDWQASLLTAHIDALHQAFRLTRRERLFVIEAIVVLPDRLHAVLTLSSKRPTSGSRAAKSTPKPRVSLVSVDPGLFLINSMILSVSPSLGHGVTLETRNNLSPSTRIRPASRSRSSSG